MNINKQVVDQLSRYFVRRDKDTTFGGNLLPSSQDTYNIGSSDRRVNVLYARAVVADNLGTTEGGAVGNADTVDGYDASSTPTANTLLPLDGSAVFPTSVYANALLVDGSRTLTGNLSASAGVTIDGVDISAHASDTNAHHNQTHSITGSDHTATGSYQQLVGFTGTNTLGFLTPTSQPGASSEILKTDSDGGIRLERLGIKNAPSTYYNIYSIQNGTAPGTSIGGILNQTVISDTSSYFGSGAFLLEQTQTSGDNSLSLTNLLARYVHNTTANHTGTIHNVVSEFYSYSSGDVSNYIDLLIGGGYNQTGNTSIGARFGVKIQNSNFPMTGTQYGLQIDSLTSGAENYAIATGTGKIVFGDNVGIQVSPVSTTGLYVYQDGSGVVSSHVYGAHIYAMSNDLQDAYSLTGLYVQSYFQDTSNSNLSAVGGEISIMHSTGATLQTATGVYTNMYMYAGGEISNWYGFQVGGGFFPSGGSVDYRRAIFVASPATNVVNNYGLLVDDQRNATGSTYSLYLGGGDIYMAYGDMSLNTVDIQTANYISQDTGWAIGYDGSADFRTIYADEMHVQAFIAEIYEAFVGAILVTKSKGRLSRNFTIPSNGNSGTIYFEDLEGWDDTQLFASSDYVLLRYIDMSGGGLIVTDVWGTVSSYTDLLGGEQSYTFTTTDDGGQSTKTIYAGAIALDYGQSGSGSQGTWEATVLDTHSPYSQVRTWATNPWTPANWTTHLRLGNLEGITSTLEYGLWAGSGYTASDQYIILSDETAKIHNMPLTVNDGSNDVIILNPSTPYISLGSPAPTTYGSGSGIWMGKDTSYKFRVGNPSGIRMAWDGTDVYFGGASEYVKVSSAGISLYSNSQESIKLDTSGNALFGQVATDYGNMLWDVSTKQLQFRGGASGAEVKAYIDTDGSLSVGEGVIKFDNLGETITAPGRIFEGLVTELDTDPIGGIYMDYNAETVIGTVESRFWFDRGNYGTEQITNGTFESGLTGWTFSESGETSYTQSGISKIGSYSMFLTASYDLGISEITAKSNSVTASAGDRFIITFYYRTYLQGTSLDHGTISVYTYGAGVSGVINYLPIQPTGKWRYVHVVTPPCPTGTTSAELRLRVASGYSGTVGIYFDQISVKKIENYTGILLDKTSIDLYNDVSVNYGDFFVKNGGISVGTVSVPDEGSIIYTGNLVSKPSGTSEYDVYAYYPLTTKSVHTSWDGDSKTTGNYTIDLTSTWTTTIPSYAKAIQVRVRVESATAGASLSVGNSTDAYQMVSYTPANSTSIPSGGNGIITLDNSNLYVIVAGATCNVYIWIVGYFI